MNYFKDCLNIEHAKTRYRELLMEHHPDHGGSEETTKTIIDQFSAFIRAFMTDSFTAYQTAYHEKYGKRYEFHTSPVSFAEIIEQIIEFNLEIEIIGFWIYAFNSHQYRDKLAGIGFWFSRKHKAWVYNGGKRKAKRRTKWSLEDIRDHYGSELIREKEEQEELTA